MEPTARTDPCPDYSHKPPRRERPDSVPRFTRPPYIRFIVCRIVPDRDGEAVVERIAVDVGCLRLRDPGNRTANLLQNQQWHAARRVHVGIEQRIDCRIRELAQELCLPVVAAPAAKDGIASALDVQLRGRLKPTLGWGSIVPERREHSLTFRDRSDIACRETQEAFARRRGHEGCVDAEFVRRLARKRMVEA